MRVLLAIWILSGLAVCAAAPPRVVPYAERTVADWDPEKAVEEARRDLAAGTPKIYRHGGIVIVEPGVGPDQFVLTKGLPRVNAGVGCVIEGGIEMRTAQGEYARRYNEYVVRHLSKR